MTPVFDSTDSWVKAGLKYVAKPSVTMSRVPGSCLPLGPLIYQVFLFLEILQTPSV